jgi:hypothetical protein
MDSNKLDMPRLPETQVDALAQACAAEERGALR